MTLSTLSAKHLYNVYFGGNWTSVNYENILAEIDWKQALKKLDGCNSIAELVFHTNYFIAGVSEVLRGKPLKIRDKFSFRCPNITCKKDWETMVAKTLENARIFSKLIEDLPEEQLKVSFVDEKYGNYFDNIHGIIEHCHYHLGQIVILKKIIK